LCKTEDGLTKCRNLWLDIKTFEIQLLVRGIIPNVAEDRHVVIVFRCEHHVLEHVRCSNTALRTTNVLINKHFLFPCLVLRKNPSGFFLFVVPLGRISCEWVTIPEQGKSSGSIATFSLWIGVFWNGVSSISDETVIPPCLGRRCLVSGNSVYHEKLRLPVE